jgi:murein peptide amidase A
VGGLALATLGVLAPGGGPTSTPAGAGGPIASQATVRIGESTRGQPIRARVLRGSVGGPVILAVGAIHGDEPAGAEIVHELRDRRPARGVVVAVPSLNPDGLDAATRTNALGVDLNRNFASGWGPHGEPGDPEHSGPAPFSERESRVARSLIRKLRPDVTIWFHQQHEPPLVRAWGHSVVAARAYARLAGTPFHVLPWLPGSAPNWQNRRFRGASAFVVELPWGEVAKRELRRHEAALLELGHALEDGA